MAGDDTQLECCGFSKVAASGQMQIPKEARDALGWDTGMRLMVFARPGNGELIVTAKPLDEALLELATGRGRPRKT